MRKRERRVLSEMGAGYVPCEVTDRYLSFNLESADLADGREFITLAVMTATEFRDGIPVKGRKLCTLVVKRRDIERALSCVKPKPIR